jgi:hypothetical protein
LSGFKLWLCGSRNRNRWQDRESVEIWREINARHFCIREVVRIGIFLPLAAYQAAPLLDLPLRRGIKGVVAGRVDAQSLRIRRIM